MFVFGTLRFLNKLKIKTSSFEIKRIFNHYTRTPSIQFAIANLIEFKDKVIRAC